MAAGADVRPEAISVPFERINGNENRPRRLENKTRYGEDYNLEFPVSLTSRALRPAELLERARPTAVDSKLRRKEGKP